MTIRSVCGACIALATLILAPAARAEEFTLLVYETPSDIMLRNDPSAAGRDYWQAYAEFGRKLEAAGAIRGGAPLVVDPVTATRDGLVLGGYFRIEAPTLAEAQALAATAPSARRNGLTVVARHAMSASAMSAN